jgi:hypothetical protein
MITTEEAERLASWCDFDGFRQRATAIRSLAAERDALLAEAERMKAGGCARDQGTTQFCAEAVALKAENARLREAMRDLLTPQTPASFAGAMIRARAALGGKE